MRRHRFVLIPVGFLPVTLIAAAAFGVAGLRDLATRVLVPAVVVALVAVGHRRSVATMAARALVAGMLATALYDAFRFSFLALGLMHRDPIPHIGVALHLHPAWLAGYVWRYVGNGGGLAIAFAALGFHGKRAGVLYGLSVCAGLLVTLAVSPYGEAMLFPLNATTVVMAIGGHAMYGAVLGSLTRQTTEDPPLIAANYVDSASFSSFSGSPVDAQEIRRYVATDRFGGVRGSREAICIDHPGRLQ